MGGNTTESSSEKPVMEKVADIAKRSAGKGADIVKDAYDKTSTKLAEVKSSLFDQGMPHLESESDFLIVSPNSKGKYVIEIEGKEKTFNKKEYFLYLYTYNLKVLSLKKARKEREKMKYEHEISKIDRYIDDRESAYDDVIASFIDTQKEFEYYRDLYNEGLGTKFYPGDSRERWLKGKMLETSKKVGGIPDKETFLYSCRFTDIDRPELGKQVFKDIRVLRSKHAKKMREINSEIKGLEAKISNNKSFLEKLQK